MIVIVDVPVLDAKYKRPPLLLVALGVSKVALANVSVIAVLETYPIPPLDLAVVGLTVLLVKEIVLAAEFEI